MLDQPKTLKILSLILAFAFALRIFLIIYPEVIHNDGIEYIRHAKQISSGDWTGGKAPPLYPALVAFNYSFIRNYELAGILVSVIFGSLLVFPIFYLGRELFNEKTGVLAAIFASVHPFLYIHSGSVLTESTYHFLLATSVLFGWKAFCEGKLQHLLLFGLSTTFAYLTRPEAIGFLFVFSIWVLFFNPPNGRRYWIKRVGMILLGVLAFIIFSSPYLIQIRKETGRWTITKKMNISAEFPTENDKKTTFSEVIKKEKKFNLILLIKDPLFLLERMGMGFLKSLYLFLLVYHPILSILAITGWTEILKKRSSYLIKGSFYILSHHLFFFTFVFSLLYFGRRYISQMVTISLPWAAFGFFGMIDWVSERFTKRKWQMHLPIILLTLLLLVLFIQGRVLHPQDHRLIRKELGLWMKDHLPRGAKIMSRLPQEAFYAELPWMQLPQESYEMIINTARSNGVQYLIVDEDIEKESPGFWGSLKKEDLVLLKDREQKKQRMVVFKIVHPR